PLATVQASRKAFTRRQEAVARHHRHLPRKGTAREEKRLTPLLAVMPSAAKTLSGYARIHFLDQQQGSSARHSTSPPRPSTTLRVGSALHVPVAPPARRSRSGQRVA